MSPALRRLLLHVPVGLVNVLLLWRCQAAGILFGLGFLAYEITQDWRIRDQCHADIVGWLWGLAGAVLGSWILAAL